MGNKKVMDLILISKGRLD